MIKQLFLPILLFTSVYAQALTEENLSSIYTEAFAFVMVIGFMSIVSIYYSRKHAKEYEINNPIEERRAARKKIEEEELKNQFIIRAVDEKGNKIDRLLELQEMFKDGIINTEELEVLKSKIKIIS